MSSTLILGYHSVAEPEIDAYSLCVTPQHFREQLEVLTKEGQVISLRELVSKLQDRNLPKRAVVLTFDDGYVDVLHHAQPLLERYQTPATVFVTAGALGREFWWDRLERMLLSPVELPASLSLELGDRSLEWVPGEPGQRLPGGSRRNLIESMYRALLPLRPEEREKAMAPLESWLGSVPDDQPSRRVMEHEELIELAACDLIEIGAHTVTHPVLADLPVPEQRAEIQKSKAHLETILGQAVTSFAYPNGSSSRETLNIVRESGFHCACASHKDVVWQGADRFHLPRFWARDWDGETFSRWLRLWLPA